MDTSPDSAVADQTEAAGDGKIHIPLSSPIRAFNKEISELVLRQPSGKDLIEIGNPVIIHWPDDPNDQPKIEHDMRRMARMIARLADLPVAAIEQVQPGDLAFAAVALQSFFLPNVRRTSSPQGSTLG